MARPTGILFDLDNTAYAYEPCHAAGMVVAQRHAATLHPRWALAREFDTDYARARQAVKRQLGKQAASHCRLLYFKNMVEAQLGRTVIAATRTLHDAYWEGYFSKMKLEPGCVELLRDLRERGVGIAWVSNYTTERQMLKLRALGLEEQVDLLVTSEEVGAEKPDSPPFRHALGRLMARPEATWMVGDDLTDDVAGAREAGLTSVWFRRQECQETSEIPDYIVRDWFELRALLDL